VKASVGPLADIRVDALNVRSAGRNGFLLPDLAPDRIVLRYFRWNAHRDSVESIDSLEPFRTSELKRPG
jgi:hypothetical protein